VSKSCAVRTRVAEPSLYPSSTVDTTSIILPHIHTLVLGGYRLQFHQWISHLVVPNLRLLRVGEELNWEYYTASSAARDRAYERRY
jgi:hypothetical protein